MKKLYEVVFVSEWNNYDQLGWYTNLDDAIEDINGELKTYANGKYQLEKGDLKEYVGSFGLCIDISLASFFCDKLEAEGEEEEEIYSELQSCEVRGYVYELDDLDYEMLVQTLINYNKEFDFKGFKLTYDKLIQMIEKGQNKAILAYLKMNEEKALYELSGSTLEKYTEITKDKSYIDFDKANINKDFIMDKAFWSEFLSQYDTKTNLCEDIALDNVEFVGYEVYQYEFFKYFVKDNDLFIQKWTYYNNNLKCVGIYQKHRKGDVVC